MARSHSRYYRNYLVFVAFFTLLVITMLAWIASARLEAFYQQHLDISHESVKGVEKQVAFFIAEKQRMVDVFAEEQIDSLRALVREPDNYDLQENLGELLTRYFPDRFAFSITDNSGEPRFEDFDGLVSNLCLADVKEFSAGAHPYHPYIHPNSEGYHFDVMVRFGENGSEGILLVSFLADVLGNILNSIQSPDHKIMLIMPQGKDLIEVIADGARNHWIREDYRLSVEEQRQIAKRHDIAGTRWQAVDFHDVGLLTNFRSKLITESAIIFLVFFTIALLVVRLRREKHHREIAEQQKQALMGVVCHEFRSPTSVIKGALELVSDGDAGKISADVKKYIEMALSSTSRLMRLVDDFLDLQKIESGKLTLKKQPGNLSTIVENAVTRNGLYAEQFSVRFELQQPLADGLVSCDEHRVEQVLTNFLSNAAKYGGKDDAIDVAVTRNDQWLRVSVRDHGPGIPTDFQSQVFQRFAMAKATHPKKKKGQQIQSSGLGLSISKAIIDQHNGQIGFDTVTEAPADSPTGTGTTFWFELKVL